MADFNDVDLDLVKQKVHELMLALNTTASRANWGVRNDEDMLVGLSPLFIRKTSVQLLKKLLADDGVDMSAKVRALDLVRSSYENISEFKGDAVLEKSLIHDNLMAQVVRFYEWHVAQQIELNKDIQALISVSAPRSKM